MDEKELEAGVTLEDLVTLAANTEEEDAILDSLKISASNALPEGWLKSRVFNLSNTELFGSENEIETLLLKKVEFAIPTIDIARAFSLTAASLNDESFRGCKSVMLCWPFCKALITSPPALVNKIRGSVVEAKLFVQSLKPMKHLLTSWTVAARELNRKEKSEQPDQQDNPEEEPPVKRACLNALENKMTSMFELLVEKIDGISRQNVQKSESSDMNDDGSEDLEESEDEFESEDILNLDRSKVSELNQPLPSWEPCVEESEPQIPEPKAALREQGIKCQKLGSTSWNRIRYKDVQKKLGASPVFNSLKVNSELMAITTSSFNESILTKADLMTGTLTHGLLLQREKLSEAFKTLLTKHPQARDDIEKLFLGESAVSTVSNDVLHYACARRAEMIELRRNSFKTVEPHQAAKLAEIPPSESHLFDEKQLSDFLYQQGGIQKVFIKPMKPTQHKESNLFRPKNRVNTENSSRPRFQPRFNHDSKSKSYTRSNAKKPESKSAKSNFSKRGDSRKRSYQFHKA